MKAVIALAAFENDDRRCMGLIVKHLAADAITIIKNSTSAKVMWADLKSS